MALPPPPYNTPVQATPASLTQPWAAWFREVFVRLTAPPSSLGTHEVWIQGDGGVGATNTTVRYFPTVRKNVGSSITYASSATNGDSWTINDTGVYAITYQDGTAVGNIEFGITINASGADLTTNVSSISPAKVIAVFSSVTSNDQLMASVTLWLNAGDVVRAQTDTAYTTSAFHGYQGVRIVRLL